MEKLGCTPINQRSLQRGFLLQLRRRLSQKRISGKLGYAFNQYGKWESGSKQLDWCDFMAICSLRGLDPVGEILHSYDIGLRKPVTAADLLRHFLRVYFHGDKRRFARFLSVSQKTLDRRLKQGDRIGFMTVLQCLSFRPQLLLAFLDKTGLLGSAPDLKKEFLRLKRLVGEEARMPYAPAVQYFLLTRQYRELRRHDSAVVARALGLTVDQVEAALRLSVATDLVRFDGRKYSLNHSGIEYKSADRAAVIAYFRHWTSRALASMTETPRPPDGTKVSGVRVFACSREAASRITTKLRETYLEVARIIDEDGERKEERDFVRVLVLHHFDPADCG